MLSKIIYFLLKFPPQQFPREKKSTRTFFKFRETAGFLLACIFSGNGRQDEVAEIFSSENETLILRNFYGWKIFGERKKVTRMQHDSFQCHDLCGTIFLSRVA
jgi:hypothetical protein